MSLWGGLQTIVDLLRNVFPTASTGVELHSTDCPAGNSIFGQLAVGVGCSSVPFVPPPLAHSAQKIYAQFPLEAIDLRCHLLQHSDIPSSAGTAGLHDAWNLSCHLKALHKLQHLANFISPGKFLGPQLREYTLFHPLFHPRHITVVFAGTQSIKLSYRTGRPRKSGP